MQTRRTLGRAVLLIPCCLLLGGACSADSVVGVTADGSGRKVPALVGQEVRITLGNVGPGEYQSPPTISSSILTFLGVDVVPPYTPAGPTQQFRFLAKAPGRAIVHFQRALNDSVFAEAEDTVEVR